MRRAEEAGAATPRIAIGARATLLALLAAALLFPAAWRAAPAARTVLVLPEDSADRRAALDVALRGDAPALVARRSADPPADAELLALAALAGRAPLLAALPAPAATLVAWPPARARAGRAAAIHFELYGEPGDSALVVLRDAAGPIDSLRVSPGAEGRARGGFRVRPERAGWHDWAIALGGVHAPAGAWVDSVAPVRVLIAAGAPDWESRFAARALEEAGALVTIAQPLGRGLAPAAAPSGLPDVAAALEPWDVVIVLPGAAAGPAQLRALAEFVEAGGGVLAVAHPGAAQAVGIARVESAPDAGAGAVRWNAPLEISALPAVSIAVPVSPLAGLAPSAIPVATIGDATVLALGPAGRGRAAVLGLPQTWRWRMEAGRIEEHRAFWRDLTDWLAGGARDPVRIRIDPAAGAPGRMVAVTSMASAGRRAPAVLSLRGPDGRTASLSTAATPHTRTARTAFFAGAPGVYVVSAADAGAGTAAFAAGPSSAAPLAWARVALTAHGSGGDAVAAGDFERRLAAVDTRPRGPRRALGALLFAAAVALALTEWSARRVRGLP